MKYLVLPLVLVVSACASQIDAQLLKNVKVVSTLPSSSCKFVRFKKCESLREDGQRRCRKTLREMAVEANADTVVIEDVFEYTGITHLDNNMFNDARTVVEAKLYRCTVIEEKPE